MIRRATAHTHRNRRSVPLFASYRRRHRREGRHKYLIAFAVVLAGADTRPVTGRDRDGALDARRRADNRRFDPRLLITAGALIFATAVWKLSRVTGERGGD